MLSGLFPGEASRPRSFAHRRLERELVARSERIAAKRCSVERKVNGQWGAGLGFGGTGATGRRRNYPVNLLCSSTVACPTDHSPCLERLK